MNSFYFACLLNTALRKNFNVTHFRLDGLSGDPVKLRITEVECNNFKYSFGYALFGSNKRGKKQIKQQLGVALMFAKPPYYSLE